MYPQTYANEYDYTCMHDKHINIYMYIHTHIHTHTYLHIHRDVQLEDNQFIDSDEENNSDEDANILKVLREENVLMETQSENQTEHEIVQVYI